MFRQTEVHYHHFDTPRKARVKGALAYAQYRKQRYGIDFSYHDIFEACQVSRSRGYEIIKSSSDRTFHNEFEETRGRKKLLTDEDIDKLKKLICYFQRLELTNKSVVRQFGELLERDIGGNALLASSRISVSEANDVIGVFLVLPKSNLRMWGRIPGFVPGVWD
ncbi:hypothetical protein Trihar35433_8802 [Trichoderma harzianum]|nr:hypothetical protein Trihar35433_8802 [Trichoderma harzianum]